MTVLLPAYNAERYLPEAIRSVLDQTHTEFELIVINDGSRDRTLEIAKEFAELDKRVRVITHTNRGIAASLNVGIEAAASDWIARMDADDIMLPTRLERQLAFFSANPTVDLTSSLVIYINERGETIGRSSSPFVRTEEVDKVVAANDIIGFHHPAVMVRKPALEGVKGYRPEFVPAEDIDLYNRMVEQGYTVLLQPEYLLKYRIHGASECAERIREQRIKLAWIKGCLTARRAGRREPSLQEFLSERAKRPFFIRLNQERKDLAKIFYKQAVTRYVSGQYSSFPRFIMAAILQPGHVLGQVGRRFRSRRSMGKSGPTGNR